MTATLQLRSTVEYPLVHVGCVNAGPAEDAGFVEQYGQRVDLLARRAAGDPDPRRWVCAEQGDDLFAYAPHQLRVAEHARHVEADRAQEALHAGGVVEDPVLVGGHGLHAFARHGRRHAAAERA